jgi:3'-5' exonuclease
VAYLNNPYLKPRIALSLDLETIPDESDAVREEVLAQVTAEVKMPGSISKPETIEAWETTRKPALIQEKYDEAVARLGLSPVTGKVLCVGIVSDGGIEMSWCGPDEREVLTLAYQYIEALEGEVTVVGHNLIGFDLPFLRGRSLVNRLRPPQILRRAMQAKPWDTTVGDTMQLWSHDRDKRISLATLCRLLSIESPKTGMTGADVYPAFKQGRLQEIADYCLGDCRAALQVYQRFQEIA